MTTEEVTSYKTIISECFESDPELIEKWHIEAGSSLENCINRTFNDLNKFNVTFYKLNIDNKLVGYFGVEGNSFLTGFFLKPEFRTKKYILEFWNIVDSKFDNSYMIGIFQKNQRASAFLRKKASSFFEYDQAIYFIVNKGV